VNLNPFRFWKGEILSLSLVLSLCLAGADPLGAQTAGFAYVTNGAEDTISAYTINATTGALTPLAGSPFGACCGVPVSLAVSANGKFAYVVLQDSNILLAYTFNATTGALTPVAGSPFAQTGSQPFSVTVDPSSQFAYVTNVLDDDVSAYTINATTGALTPVAGSPFAAGFQPQSVAVSPNGKFAYVANRGGSVSAYTINATTGALTPLAGSPFPAAGQSQSVTVHPSGKFVYVANAVVNNALGVSAYAINATTGALTPLTGSPFPAGSEPQSVAVSPNGKFAYVANEGGVGNQGGSVSAYTINTTTGALTPVAGSPFAPTGNPLVSVTVDASSQFAYVANLGANDVSAYTINSTTGALTPVAGSPFATGVAPTSVTTTVPASSCRHDDEDRDRDERGDHDEQRDGRGRDDDEQREGRGRDDDEHHGHRFDRKHGCHHFGEKDFDEHDNDDAHERERGRY
jgi:6-phosphogluconolactonase